MDIPYTVGARPDTGLHNGKFGVWLFLASEVMLFGALFSTYILLRVGATEWPHGELSVVLGTINTIILISSSVTMVMACSDTGDVQADITAAASRTQSPIKIASKDRAAWITNGLPIRRETDE